ncbi:MAG: PQQ-dependent sugar dehydrogenase, partial [Puniceicoccales bacterium]
SGAHFGTRFVFKDGYLFFSMGDRGKQNMAQDVTRPNGKIHRIHDDGRIPEDNPFVDKPDAWPTIWTYGNRNPQGLDAHPITGALWETEHGPRGGDEVNLIRKGINYGWPVITYGMNYSGTPITDKTHAPGMEQPKHYWVPSIAVCGIDFYEGELFPNWKNNLFAGGLASNELHRIVINDDNEVVKDEIVLKGLGRIRDVASAPDGSLMLLLNGPDKIVKLVPVE